MRRVGFPAGPQDLHSLPTVAMNATDGVARWELLGPRGEPFTLVHRPTFIDDDLLSLKCAVGQDTGMCVLPDYLCSDEVRDGLLAPVLPGWELPQARVLAVFPSRRGMVPAVRSLLDFLGENMSGERIVGDVVTTSYATQRPATSQ